MTRRFVLPLALLMVVTSCGGDSESAQTTAPAEAAMTTTRAASTTQTAAPALRFLAAECEFEPAPGADVECGWLEVPENRANPDNSRTLRLHSAVYRSTASTPEPDPVLYIFSGPGDPSLDIATWLYAELVQLFTNRRDVIVIDQRGSGYSEPLMTCPEGIAAEYDVLDESLTKDEEQQRIAAGYGQCRDRLTAEGVDLTGYNTAQSAADIGDLMEALDYAQYNVFAVGYGSRVALTVLRDHPELIRSMVLDSVYPPDVDTTAERPEIVADAIAGLFAECAANPSCGPDYPDLEQQFWDLVERLDASPVAVREFPPQGGTGHDVVVDGDLLIRSVERALADPGLIAQVPKRIARTHEGDDSALDLFVKVALGMLDETYPVAVGISTYCHEEAPFIDDAAYEAAVDEVGRLAVAFESPADAATYCDLWPAGVAADTERQPVASGVPVLAIQGEFDPLTPTRWAHHAAASLPNASVVEFPAHSHWVTLHHVCSREVAVRFVADPDSDLDTSCLETIQPIRFWQPTSSG